MQYSQLFETVIFESFSKLQDAINNCQLDEINEVLNNPDFVSIDFVDEDNKNCLELALNMGYTEVVEMLLGKYC